MKHTLLSTCHISDGPLIVVNRRYPLRTGVPPVLCPFDSRYPHILLEKTAAHALRACMRQIHGRQAILPVSGFRSRAEQARLWHSSIAENGEAFTRRFVAPAGCSEHETGLAVDLGFSGGPVDIIRPAFPVDGVCGRFRRQAAHFGFILRYPADKTNLTFIDEEPWHFRYVGAPHAQLMVENGLCLEEYPAFLQAASRRCVLSNGKTATVAYLSAKELEESADVLQARGTTIHVSGDNMNGFIVTDWGDAS